MENKIVIAGKKAAFSMDLIIYSFGRIQTTVEKHVPRIPYTKELPIIRKLVLKPNDFFPSACFLLLA